MSRRSPLRRPADIAAEAGRSGSRTSGDEPPAGWPDGFVGTPEDRSALLVLLGLASLTARRLLELSQKYPTATSCLQAVLRGEAGSAADQAIAGAADPDGVEKRLEELEARLVSVGDDEYPGSLLELFDPPAGLFLRGALIPEERRVAVVGARNCSPSGKDMAESLGSELGRAGVSVVSGAARGIDSAAHRGALRSGGRSIAVLGCGVDVAYPRGNRGLLDEICSAGTLVSEYPPGTPPEPFRFPARNRIVAGLSVAVVVVEGTAGSGSMITADHALDLGREVFAVPGSVTSELAAAPLALVRDGASLIRGPGDLLGDLGMERIEPDGGPDPGRGTSSSRAVWEALRGPTTADALAAATGFQLAEVIATLVTMELDGLVTHAGGRYERRLKRLGGS